VPLSTDYGMIVVDIRLWPRILLGIVVGASLSVAGASFQALLRNPRLPIPYVLGVSSGAAVGAIICPQSSESHLALSPEIAGLITPFGAFPRRGRHDCGRLFPWAAAMVDRQQHSSPRRINQSLPLFFPPSSCFS